MKIEKSTPKNNSEKFVKFQKFPDLNGMSELLEILKENNIPYEIDDSGQRYSLVSDPFDKFFIVKIRETDVEKINILIDKKDTKDFANHSVDHYLYTFSDDDIIDVIANPDEWSGLEVKIANKIIKDRNIELSVDVLTSSKKKNIEKEVRKELEIKKEINKGANWFLAIAILSVLNTVALVLQLKYGLIFGLGITQISDGLLFAIFEKFTIYNIFVSAVISSVFVLLWYYAKRNKKWAFWTGIIIYGLDALIFLFVKDFISFGLHIFVLLAVGNSFLASIRKEKEAEFKTIK